ncbi:MAG: DUF429 domain-containing protein [Candidatus Lokiarchaeota archaeon]
MSIYRQSLGVDGCRGGWIAVISDSKDNWDLDFFSNIHKLWKKYRNSDLILIDIPIGLIEKGKKPRKCDKEARKYLTGLRSSSIFPVPCRNAIYAKNYQEANLINRNLTGKGISKQSWNITPKIKEVDMLLTTNKNAKNKLIESHPEVCFTALAHGNPLKYSKKTEKGLEERKKLLSSYSISIINLIDDHIDKLEKSEVKADDLLDASILALSAKLGLSKIFFLPKRYKCDMKGIPMRIVLPKFY